MGAFGVNVEEMDYFFYIFHIFHIYKVLEFLGVVVGGGGVRREGCGQGLSLMGLFPQPRLCF